jgi:hypothetical protein
MKNKRAIFGYLFILLLFIGAFACTRYIVTQKTDIGILSNCITNGQSLISNINQKCLVETVGALLKTRSTAELMQYISAPTSPKIISTNCHAIAHVIGEQTFKSAGSIEAAEQRCTLDCQIGCVHGVMEAAVTQELGGTSTPVGNTDDIVHADFSKLEQIGSKYCNVLSNCHGMGHLLYIATDNYSKALSGCSTISPNTSASETCYQGVFMEGGGGGDSLGFITRPTVGSSTDYAYPCDSIGSEYLHACYRYLPRYQEALFDKNKIIDISVRRAIMLQTCAKESTVARGYCYEGLAFFAPHVMLMTETEIRLWCDNLTTTTDRESCNLGHENQFLWENSSPGLIAAFNYCGAMSRADDANTCYNVSFQYVISNVTRDQVQAICNSADDPMQCSKNLELYFDIKKKLPHYQNGLFL